MEARAGRAPGVRNSGRIAPTAKGLRLNDGRARLFDPPARIEGADWAAPEDEPLRLIVPSGLEGAKGRPFEAAITTA
ncbi:MAG: hypothetical protein AAF982_07135 [Pseudomonadota bacterium]